jgi:hypothetical protein
MTTIPNRNPEFMYSQAFEVSSNANNLSMAGFTECILGKARSG